METRTLGFLLHDATRLLRKRFDQRAGDLGLSSAQWRMMMNVCKTEGGAPQSRFADLLDIEPISVSRLLDRMEVQGWVTRQPDPADRRVRRVFPTEKAKAAHQGVKSIADGVYAEALGGLSEDERQTLVKGLAMIISNLSKAEECGQKEPS